MTKFYWQLPEKLQKAAHMEAVKDLDNTPRHLLDKGNPNHPDNFTCNLFGYKEEELMSKQYEENNANNENIEDYRMSGGREEHFARKEAIENELDWIGSELTLSNTAAIHLDLIQEALAQGLQITPYPIYTEPKHSVLVQKKLLPKQDGKTIELWCMKQYKAYPNELCATLAAIENVLQQIKDNTCV